LNSCTLSSSLCELWGDFWRFFVASFSVVGSVLRRRSFLSSSLDPESLLELLSLRDADFANFFDCGMPLNGTALLRSSLELESSELEDELFFLFSSLIGIRILLVMLVELDSALENWHETFT
jgi:hypothetical protein